MVEPISPPLYLDIPSGIKIPVFLIGDQDISLDRIRKPRTFDFIVTIRIRTYRNFLNILFAALECNEYPLQRPAVSFIHNPAAYYQGTFLGTQAKI